MAVPLLSLLPQSVRNAYPAIVGGVRRGLSGGAIVQTIRRAGMPITPSSTLTSLFNQLRRIEIHGANIRFANKRFRINTGALPESVTDIRRRFSYTYLVRGIDELGDRVERNITIRTDDELLTVAQLDEKAVEIANRKTRSGNLSEVTVVLDFGVRRAEQFG